MENQYKILAVDDNPQNIKVIGSILRKANYLVGFAFNGQQALDLLDQSNDYDLVLLDVNMPIMNGYETCINIRKRKNLEELPIIFLTALSETDNIVRGLDSGAQDYVAKPFNGRELLARVQTHIELKRSKQKLRQMNDILELKVNERTRDLKTANRNLAVANKKLEETNQELAKLDEAKVDFLRILSHEINTPLNGIVGFTNILKEELKEPEFYELVGFLDESAKRLERFASVSLLITELKTQQKIIKWEEIDIRSLVEKIVEFCPENMTVGDCPEVKLSAGEQLFLADGGLLEIALKSIIENAIHYAGADGQVEIETYNERDFSILEIKDNGPGFPAYLLENPFKLFSYEKRGHVDEKKGLGLALVKLIMEVHGGEIELKNSDAGGALVRLSFRKKKSKK